MKIQFLLMIISEISNKKYKVFNKDYLLLLLININYWKLTNSTSKIKVAFGGITPG